MMIRLNMRFQNDACSRRRGYLALVPAQPRMSRLDATFRVIPTIYSVEQQEART